MSEIEERRIGDHTVRIDRGLCVGFGHCMEEAPDAFVLGDDDIATFANPQEVERECLLTACELCPIEALTVLDDAGSQLVP